MENVSVLPEVIERPTTPGISYVADQFRDALYYDKSTFTVSQKEEKAYGIFLKNLEKVEKDLGSDSDARLTMSIIGQVLNFECRKYRSSAIDVVEENFNDIAKRLTTVGLDDPNEIGETPNTLAVLTETLDEIGFSDPRSAKYFSLLEGQKDKVLDIVRTKDTRMAESLARILFNIRQREGDGDSNKTDKLIKGLLFAEDIPDNSRYYFFNQLQKDYRPNLVYRFFGEELGKYIKDQYKREDIVRSFLCLSKHDVYSLNYYDVYKTLKVCQEVDQGISGGCERLNKIFGITHFGRYPSNVLIEQLNDWDSGDNTRYGVLIGSWSDWNNAFNDTRGEREGTILSIISQAKKYGFKTRVMEAGNKEEFVMRQIALRNGFVGAGKFHFLTISAHGTPNGFQLGDNNIGRVNVEDIPLLKKDLASLYGPYMQTLFFSCSTGVENGFAEKWADSRIESVGPDRVTSEKEVEVFSRPGGLLGFRVAYHRKANANRYPKLG